MTTDPDRRDPSQHSHLESLGRFHGGRKINAPIANKTEKAAYQTRKLVNAITAIIIANVVKTVNMHILYCSLLPMLQL